MSAVLCQSEGEQWGHSYNHTLSATYTHITLSRHCCIFCGAGIFDNMLMNGYFGDMVVILVISIIMVIVSRKMVLGDKRYSFHSSSIVGNDLKVIKEFKKYIFFTLFF